MKRLTKRVLVVSDEQALLKALEGLSTSQVDAIKATVKAVTCTRVFNDNTLASVADQSDAEIALRDQLDHELGIEIGALVTFEETDEPD